MLARARSSHNLTLLLAMILAWPANFSLIAQDIASTSQASPSTVLRPAGAGFHRSDRHTDVDQGDWPIFADNSESFDNRDDFRYAPLAIPHQPRDLPSLVPCALVFRPLDPANPGTSFIISPPLRC